MQARHLDARSAALLAKIALSRTREYGRIRPYSPRKVLCVDSLRSPRCPPTARGADAPSGFGTLPTSRGALSRQIAGGFAPCFARCSTPADNCYSSARFQPQSTAGASTRFTAARAFAPPAHPPLRRAQLLCCMRPAAPAVSARALSVASSRRGAAEPPLGVAADRFPGVRSWPTPRRRLGSGSYGAVASAAHPPRFNSVLALLSSKAESPRNDLYSE